MNFCGQGRTLGGGLEGTSFSPQKSVKAEGAECVRAYAEHAASSDGRQYAGFDPALNRPFGDVFERRNLLDCKERFEFRIMRGLSHRLLPVP